MERTWDDEDEDEDGDGCRAWNMFSVCLSFVLSPCNLRQSLNLNGQPEGPTDGHGCLADGERGRHGMSASVAGDVSRLVGGNGSSCQTSAAAAVAFKVAPGARKIAANWGLA